MCIIIRHLSTSYLTGNFWSVTKRERMVSRRGRLDRSHDGHKNLPSLLSFTLLRWEEGTQAPEKNNKPNIREDKLYNGSSIISMYIFSLNFKWHHSGFGAVSFVFDMTNSPLFEVLTMTEQLTNFHHITVHPHCFHPLQPPHILYLPQNPYPFHSILFKKIASCSACLHTSTLLKDSQHLSSYSLCINISHFSDPCTKYELSTRHVFQRCNTHLLNE